MSTFAERRDLLANLLADAGCDAIVVAHPPHVRWLTGFTGSNGGVLLGADGSVTVSTDGRYVTQIGVEAPGLELRKARECAVELVGAAAGAEVGRIGFEADHARAVVIHRLGVDDNRCEVERSESENDRKKRRSRFDEFFHRSFL